MTHSTVIPEKKMETEFTVRFESLPESVVALLYLPYLCVNDQQPHKEGDARVWAEKMMATGEIAAIMFAGDEGGAPTP